MQYLKQFFLPIFFILIIVKFNFGQAQATINNQRTFGGDWTEFMQSSTQLTNGDIIVGGWSFSGLSADKTEANYGENDYWIVSLGTDLSVNWQKTLGGDLGDALHVLKATPDGGVLCGGRSASTISGNKTAPNIGGRDYWLVKLNGNGDIEWQETYGGNSNDDLIDIVELSNGDYYLVGTSDSDISGDKTENSKGFSDYWILRIDSDGNVIWDKTIGGSAYESLSGTCATIDLNDNLYVTGRSDSDMSGDKTEDNYGFINVWVVKVDPSSNVLWDKTLGGDFFEDFGHPVYYDNYLYVASTSGSGISGTKTQPNIGQSDYWINKLTLDGDIVWDKVIGGDLIELISSMSLTSGNHLLIAGSSASGISGDKTEDTNGQIDMWPVCIDTTGTVLWQKTIGGSAVDNLASIIEIAPNEFLLFGDSRSNISGDKSENSRGEEDYWMVSITSTANIIEISENSIRIYPNPVSDKLNLSFDKAQSRGRLEMVGIDGKVVYLTELNNAITFVIDVSRFSSGVYFINYTDEKNQKITKKVIVN